MTQLQELFNKIENCNKWIKIHKNNIYNAETSEFSRNEVSRLKTIKDSLQIEFDKLYDSNN